MFSADIAECLNEHGHCTFCHAKAEAVEAATVDAEISGEDWTVEARRNLNADLLPRSA